MINCKDCMYWVHRESEKGECHFNIPVIFDDEAVGFWPTTFDDDCCAQGKSKEDRHYSPIAHESNPLPRTRPIYTTQKINKMQRVVDAAILSLDKCQLELLEAVKEYQCQKS